MSLFIGNREVSHEELRAELLGEAMVYQAAGNHDVANSIFNSILIGDIAWETREGLVEEV